MKHIIQYLYGLIFILLSTTFFISCTSTEEPDMPKIDSSITLSHKLLSTNSSGGNISVTVKCKDYVDLSIDCDWISLGNYDYVDDETITYKFKVERYEGDDIRTAEICFTNETNKEILTINQSGSKIVSTSVDNLSFWDNGGDETIILSCPIPDLEYTVSCEAEWIHMEKQGNEVSISCNPLVDNEQNRSVEILINAINIDESISLSVNQKRMISLKRNSMSIEEGETSTIEYVINSPDFKDEIEFISSDENIVHVSENGYIRAISPGQADIIVETKDRKYKATCKVFVQSFDITKHISLEIEDRIVDSEKGTHNIYYTFYNKSNKTIKISKSWIYFNGNPQFGDTGKYTVSGNSYFQKHTWRYSSTMKVGFEVYYEYGGTEYRIYKDVILEAYF